MSNKSLPYMRGGGSICRSAHSNARNTVVILFSSFCNATDTYIDCMYKLYIQSIYVTVCISSILKRPVNVRVEVSLNFIIIT